MTSMDDLTRFAEFATLLADESAKVIRLHFGVTSLQIDSKSDLTPVTEADRGAESLMRSMIGSSYPEHGVLAEEFGSHDLDAPYVWVLDPIDGTKSFIKAVPLFVTLIGLLHHREPVLGLIHQPITRQLCLGSASGTYLNGRSVHCRATQRLEDAVITCTDPKSIASGCTKDAFRRLVDGSEAFRTWGDGYAYLMVASGQADIALDRVMAPWDYLPLIPVVKGAGGCVSDWRGAPPVDGGSFLASATPELHAEVLELLRTST